VILQIGTLIISGNLTENKSSTAKIMEKRHIPLNNPEMHLLIQA
jgi:hypothetical protein